MSSVGFQILRSSDAGAPTLNGTAGSLIGVLDVLLDIGGSDAYWAKAYSGTNKAAYRAASGERFYLRVDDSNAQYGLVRGFATMSDVDTGTGQFPDNTQQTNYAWPKSATANSTARTYLGIATDRFFLLLVDGGWSGVGQDLYFFGEPKKTNAADVGSTIIRAYNATTMGGSGFLTGGQSSQSPFNQNSGYSTPGDNTATMVVFAKSADGSTASAKGRYFTALPDSSVRFATYTDIQALPLYIGSTVGVGSVGKMRGSIPHVYATMNDGSDPNLALADTFTDADGATYQLAFPAGTSALSSNYGFLAIMTSNSESAGL